jgi:uncharacterized protein
MAVSLYDVSVASFLQMLDGTIGFLELGRKHCQSNRIDTAEIVAMRLHPDMLPFAFQVHSIVHHSINAIEGAKAGSFTVPSPLPELDYAGWQARVADARTRLAALNRDEVDKLQGKDVVFRYQAMQIPFTAENFLMSFSLPNFYFHVTTAYDMLRIKGVPVGKGDYLGTMRVKK